MKAATITASALTLPLLHPITIARGTSTESRTVFVRATCDGLEGIGEAAPIARYDEDVETVVAYFAELRVPIDAGNFDAALDGVPKGARCGLDIALHDLLGKRLNAPLWELFGVDPAAIPLTSFTIYIDDLAATLNEVRTYRDAPILKVKLGLGNDIETIEAIRSVYTGVIRIDANEGWTPEQAVALLRELERFGIEFCEQPIKAGRPDALRWVREHSKIPIVTDEDSVSATDLPKLAGCVDGINVKLAKCGGIRAAVEMIHVARALGLKIMLGCMTESSVLITAAAHIAPLVDWIDLDGNLMLAREPFSGVQHAAGKLTLSGRPGLGIVEMAAVR